MRSEFGREPVEAPLRAALSANDSSALLAAITGAAEIRRRFEFFSWTQGHLQALLPHGVLICGLPRGSGTGMFFDYFHNVPLPTQSLARLCHPRDGIALGMLDAWRAQGGEPLVIQAGRYETAGIYSELQDLGLGATLAHGIPFQQSSLGAHGFFAFVSLRETPGEREMTLAGLAVPFVFSTYCRALSRDRAPIAVAPAATEGALSGREIEILHWVREGKSNHEIGLVLSISPLTVKNHIQRILKKLSANNRTQAVSKALAMRLLGSAGPLGGMAGGFTGVAREDDAIAEL